MILDTLTSCHTYVNLHPGLRAAITFLASPGATRLAPGRYPIEGDAVFAIVDRTHGKGQDQAILESHRGHIDVQYVVAGHEVMGWAPAGSCTLDHSGFNHEQDLGFFLEKPHSWFQVQPGDCAIFFPGDAHAPLAGHGEVHKIVVKLALR